MARVWMHNGFLQVEGEKMSKSLGNFITIRNFWTRAGPAKCCDSTCCGRITGSRSTGRKEPGGEREDPDRVVRTGRSREDAAVAPGVSRLSRTISIRRRPSPNCTGWTGRATLQSSTLRWPSLASRRDAEGARGGAGERGRRYGVEGRTADRCPSRSAKAERFQRERSYSRRVGRDGRDAQGRQKIKRRARSRRRGSWQMTTESKRCGGG